MEHFLTVWAACANSNRPTSVDPVKVSLRTNGLAVSSPAMSRVSFPVITLNTPAGTPARCASSARARAVMGVWLAGFTTIVQPAASAGAALRVIMAAGKFQGVIAAQTPMGSRSTTMRCVSLTPGIKSPRTRVASSENHRTNDAA
ncbi:hypothetical protein D3C84_870720 [compost metagenome]